MQKLLLKNRQQPFGSKWCPNKPTISCKTKKLNASKGVAIEVLVKSAIIVTKQTDDRGGNN